MKRFSQRVRKNGSSPRFRSQVKRPPIAMVTGVIFALLGLWTMISGALLEGAGVMMVGLGCTSIGLDPFNRDRSSDN